MKLKKQKINNLHSNYYIFRSFLISDFLLLASCFLFLASCSSLYAVNTGADFLKLGIGARPSALGECGAALSSDVTAIYWNPAGLAKIEKMELVAAHSQTVMDATFGFLGFAYPNKKFGNFGVGSTLFIPESVPITTTSEETEGQLRWLDVAFTLSYGRDIINNLSAGIGFKIIHRKESSPIFDTKGTAYAGDFGFIYQLNPDFIAEKDEKLNLGFSMSNLGNKIQMSGETKKDNLPQTTRLGFAYEFHPNNENAIIVLSEVNKILDEKLGFGFGTEYKLREPVFIRFGYLTKEGNIKGITYGFGINVKGFQLDYSNVPVSELVGWTRDNRISLIVRF
ncbi:MAG: PorV/PorQ family protein [Elusimicrobia bacterium]|nr:PorV/PorQ family protein [Elusimicrobiota bacterium]